jgi:hypothetical protein
LTEVDEDRAFVVDAKAGALMDEIVETAIAPAWNQLGLGVPQAANDDGVRVGAAHVTENDLLTVELVEARGNLLFPCPMRQLDSAILVTQIDAGGNRFPPRPLRPNATTLLQHGNIAVYLPRLYKDHIAFHVDTAHVLGVVRQPRLQDDGRLKDVPRTA